MLVYRCSYISMTLAALVVLFSVATPLSEAYMVGGRFTINGPGVSFGNVQPTKFSARTPKVSNTAMKAIPPPKNPAQRMLDFYCSLVWIARPDLFIYDRLARIAWDNISKNLKKMEQDNLPENVLNRALKEMQVSATTSS